MTQWRIQRAAWTSFWGETKLPWLLPQVGQNQVTGGLATFWGTSHAWVNTCLIAPKHRVLSESDNFSARKRKIYDYSINRKVFIIYPTQPLMPTKITGAFPQALGTAALQLSRLKAVAHTAAVEHGTCGQMRRTISTNTAMFVANYNHLIDG